MNEDGRRASGHDLEEELFIYRSILDQMPGYAVMVIDKNNKILLYNKLSSMLDNIPQSAVEGEDVNSMLIDSGEDSLQEVMRTGKPKYNYTNTYHLTNSRTVKIYGNCIPIKKDGKVIASCSFIRQQNEVQTHLSEIRELQRRIEAVNRKNYNGTRYSFEDIIGSSTAMQAAIEKCRRAAKFKRPVLLYGETGTGKELFAQSIHNVSVPTEPFLAINCAAIPETLLESTLFGTSTGAFTGAESKKGLFEQAGNGTIFLDEINSMPMQLQSKLLRVLQEKTVRRLGGESEIPVNCRIISSCNKAPKECIREEQMREDLYYRIAAIRIDIPPLRDRGRDIIELAEYYRERFELDVDWGRHEFTDGAKKAMLEYKWPGNVRELQYAVESALLMSQDGEDITERDLIMEIVSDRDEKETAGPAAQEDDLETLLLTVEKQKILEALEATKWNVSLAARRVGYTRQKLQFRMKKLSIFR